MLLSDPLGDLLTRIRNGQAARLTSVNSPASKLRTNVLEVLKREGYIRDYNVSKKQSGSAEVSVELKYSEGQPVIREIARVSKPGRRVYTRVKDVQKVYSGLGISIISTPRGVMSGKEARDRGLADLGVELAVVVVLDPGLRRLVENGQRQIGHVLQHGDQPALDGAPECLLLCVLIRAVGQRGLVQDAEPGEALGDLGRRHCGAVVAQRRAWQTALLERL